MRYSRPDAEMLANLLTEVTVEYGHVALVAYRKIRENGLLSGETWMPYVKDLMADTDLMVVYDSGLRGGLIEVGMAYALGLPVWLLHEQGMAVSNSMLGCAARVMPYAAPDDLVRQLQQSYQAWT